MNEDRFITYLKNRLIEIIFSSVLLMGIGWIGFNTYIGYVMTDKEKQIIELYENYNKFKEWAKPYIQRGYKERDLWDYIEKQAGEIEEKYSIFNLRNIKVLIGVLIFFWLFPTLLVAVAYFYIRKKYNFFFQVGKIEPPLKLGKAKTLWFFKDSKKPILDLTKKEFIEEIFKGHYDKYILTLAFFNGEIIEKGKIKFDRVKVNQRIKEYTDKLVNWGIAIGELKENEVKKFKAIMYLSLMHHIASLYGSIPAGFLSPFIEDEVAKIFLATYYYKKLLKNNETVYRFQTILHTFPEDILDNLKKEFTPLSWEKLEGLQYDLEME